MAVAPALEELRRYAHPGIRHGPVFLCRQLGVQTVRAPHVSRALADAILPYLRPQDHIVQYGDFDSGLEHSPSILIAMYGFTTDASEPTSEIGSNYPDAPPTFLDDKQFPAFWKGPERVFIFVPEEFRKDALSRLPPDSSYLLAESAGKYIFVNQPVRPDLPRLASVLKRHPVE